MPPPFASCAIATICAQGGALKLVRQSGIIRTAYSENPDNEKSQPCRHERLRRHRRARELCEGRDAARRIALVAEREPARAGRTARRAPSQPDDAKRGPDRSRRASADAIASAA